MEEKKRQPNPDMFKPVEPVKMFDDLFYIGSKGVGIFVLKTSEGLIFFDATDNANADEEIVKPSLEKLGLADEKILAIFITHGHFDHYLGAESIRRRTGCEVGLTMEDTAFIIYSPENRTIPGKIFKSDTVPAITFYVKDGEEYTYGEHTIKVIFTPGHTPGCLNFAFDVHENGETHRVALMGGYGIFGPGRYPDPVYPYGTQAAVDNALVFASACEKFWQHCTATNCDIYLNPHPHLCGLFEQAEKNKTRAEGQLNAHVIGLEGVRKWVLDRFEACLESASFFATITKSVE